MPRFVVPDRPGGAPMWLSDFRVVLEDRVIDRGAVRIESGTIAEIAEAPVAGAAIEGDGRLLLPGFVDMHGDMIEREVEPRPGVRMPLELGLADLDRRLAAAGVTTAFAAVSFNPTSAYGHVRSFEHSKTMLRALKTQRQGLSVDHKVHARFEITYPDALSVVADLIAEGTADLVSLTDHTPGQGQFRDLERLASNTARNRGISRAEAVALVDERIARKRAKAGDVAATLSQVSEICAAHGIAMASHDDDSPEKVALMAGHGAAISEFPVTLEAAQAARAAGLKIAMGAPNVLRGESASGNLSGRAAHATGLLDILAADYHPSAIWPAVLALAATDPRGISGAVCLASSGPARALGLTDRGAIREGLRADLVIADDARVGRVCAVFSEGRPIYSDGTV